MLTAGAATESETPNRNNGEEETMIERVGRVVGENPV